MITKRYYKKKLVNQNISVEYSSEEDQIDVVIERQFKNGYSITRDCFRIHPSYLEPLYRLLKEATEPEVREG